jgi:hypothetical protein
MADRVTKGDLRQLIYSEHQAKKQRTSSGAAAMTLGVAKVVTLNTEDHTITLRQVLGADQEFQRNPVAMTYPGAGRRHFFGALPEEGDYCLIGHLAQETDGRTTTPVILGWIVPGTWVGHDWMVTQPFAPDEWSMDPKDSFFVAGAFERVRHKLRHYEPGNVAGSSSQGADFVLNEEVLLSNRRGNEFRLRDQDQAAVTRACQQFTALSGTRTYSGMVQREATFLPTQMVSDGVDWAGPRQFNVDENRPFTDAEMREFPSTEQVGDLIPNPVFDRRAEDGLLGDRKSGVAFEPNADPYEFLKRGMFVGEGGKIFDIAHQSNAVYGGKPLYRTSVVHDSDGRPLNAVIGVGDQARAYTEHRIEVSHTSDGKLPVTEQTDDFDADRLPRTRPTGVDPQGRSAKAPFVEFVLGTVVGNDPFSKAGRLQYGLPLTPVIFDQTGGPAPSLESGAQVPLDQQAASLFQLFPPTLNGGPPTFWSTTKDGRFFASIGGPQTEDYSAEIALRSGMRLSLGGKLRLEPEQGIELRVGNGDPINNFGLDLSSDKGAVRVYGGGNTTQGALGARSAPVDGGETDAPSLIMEGRFNALLKASRKLTFNAQEQETRVTSSVTKALSNVDMQAGDRINMASKSFDQLVNGKAVVAFQGYKDNLPTNGPFRETTFSGIGVGTIDQYLAVLGDREEEFLLGNHTTTIRVGNFTYETDAGQWSARAGLNTATLDIATGFEVLVTTGNIQMDAAFGAAVITGLTNITAKSQGTAILSGTAGVSLGGPGKVGSIVSSSDLDPLTGAPLATYGMGSPGHSLTTAV